MFDWIADWIAAGGPWGVGALMLLENVFPPIPSELVMPLAGFLAADGQMSPVAVIFAGTVGSVLGALVWYWVGAAFGQARMMQFIDRYGHWLTLSRAEAEAALAWFERRGAAAVFLGRMVPAVRTLISVPAGLARMPLGLFLILTTAGSLIWVTALTAAGYLLKAQYHAVEVWLDPVTKILVAAVVLIYLWRVWRIWRAR